MTAVYKTGQITLANGSAVVTGIGTAWATMLIAGGIIFPVADGNPLAIQEIVSNTSITAEKPWAGVSGTYDYVLVRWSADEEQNSVNSSVLATIYAELQAGSLWKYDVSGSTADRAIYNERPNGFSYLAIDVNPAQLYIKASATSADWAGPFTYGTGPEGPEGPAGYANPRGIYSAATAYFRNDAVLYNGSSFVALQATTGNAPPTLPATSNAYWQLTAIKGTDGNGTGDLVGPNGVIDGNVAVFDGVTGKLLKQQTKTQFKTWLATTALDVSFSNGVANLPGNPTTAQAAIEAISNSGGKNDALFAIQIADLLGQRMGMVGGVADSFDDTSGVVTSGIGGIDPYASVMLHLDGADGSTTISDSAFIGRAWTLNGSAAISTAQSRFGGASLSISTAAGYARTTSFSDLAFGTGDYTIDFWFRPNAPGTNFLVSMVSSSAATMAPVLFLSAGKLSLYLNNVTAITGTTTLSANAWSHIALVRNSGVTRIYLNGIQEGASYTDSGSYIAQSMVIGASFDFNPSNSANGFIDEFRITKGVARWTAAFTPPAMAYNVVGGNDANATLLLHMDGSNGSTSFPDSSPSPVSVTATGDAKTSTAQSKFGASSLILDGTGDYLTTAVSSAFALGTGDFTVEGWFRPSTTPYGNLIDFRSSSQTANPVLYILNGATVGYYTASANRITSTTVLAANTWYHVALVRASGTTRLYINGVQEGVAYADSSNYASPAAGVRIGCSYSAADFFTGNIDEVRISNVARYATNFTPYNVAFFTDTLGSSNFVYDATNDWFTPSPVVGTRVINPTLEAETSISTLRRYRVKFSPGSLSTSGTFFRTLVNAVAAAPGKLITNMFISEAAATGNAWDMVATPSPTRITFAGGSSSVRPVTTGTQWSDWINYPIDVTKSYIIAFDMEASNGTLRYSTTTPTSTATYYKDGGTDEAGTPVVTGYTAFSGFQAFSQIEVKSTSADYFNMTLLSVNYTASSVPSTGRVAVQLADTLALTPNTDFSMEITRDGGNTWSAVTLALSMPLFGGVKMYEGTVSLAGQPSGTAMAWRFKTLTNKNIIASGVVLQQS